VLSTLALKGALDAAAPGLRAEFHATQALLKSIADGATGDVVILTDEGIETLAREGRLLAYRHRGLWVTVNTPKDLRRAQEHAAADPGWLWG
jgi:hypothetical protein